MKEQLISFETAKLAKEKGFDFDCTNAYWDDSTHELMGEDTPEHSGISKYCFSAPTQSLLQKWLREKHFIFIEISLNFCPDSEKDFGYGVSLMDNIEVFDGVNWIGLDITGKWFKTYEQALEIGLQEALKLIND